MRALILLLLSLTLQFTHAQKQPTSTPSWFQNLPVKVYYFDDTTNILYHDAVEGIVHVSDDEGKTFMPADGVPQGAAVALVEHPFDNTVAFILGKDKTHWRTKNRGKTWQSFSTPDPVDLGSNPLGFHVNQDYLGHVILQGIRCVNRLFIRICSSHTYYTTDLFTSEPKLLLDDARKCLFAHSDKEFKHSAPGNLVFCIAFDQQTSNGQYTLESARVLQSTDFFEHDTKIVSLPGLGEKKSRGVLALAVTGQFLIAAVRDLDATATSASNMHLFVTGDAEVWAKAQFPHASSSSLREDAYTLLTGTTHSLAVDVLLQTHASIGTLFVSNSNGTFFVESLPHTNRNRDGFVDFEAVYGLEGVAIAGVVANPEDVGSRGADKVVKSVITFDDGSSWAPIPCVAPSAECGIHFHSVTNPHNFGRVFSSPAPGYIVGVGSTGTQLKPYEESSTWVSNDGGVSWTPLDGGPMKYEIGGKGTVMVFIEDTDYVDGIKYSLDGGQTLKDLKFTNNLSVRAKALMTLPDSTSSKFLLIASLKPGNMNTQGNHVSIFLDFKDVWDRDCDTSAGSADMEKWYARSGTKSDCVMGHKQFYMRRKKLAQCNVGHKFEDPKSVEEDCECAEHDYECDYNFVRSGSECVAAGPIPVEGDSCSKGTPGEKFTGSSGYRKIPGNTCTGGVKLDAPIERECKDAQPKEGEVIHKIFDFPAEVTQNAFFPESTTVLVRLADGSIYLSANEGYAWKQLFQEDTFLAFYIHPYSNERAYLITSSRKIWYTKNKGENWQEITAPSDPSIFGMMALQFHPLESDWLIWSGTTGQCTGSSAEHCAAEASYSTNNGGSWKQVDEYVKTCQWARDKELRIDAMLIVCESYRDKKGDQRKFNTGTIGSVNNPARLVEGSPYYSNPRVIFENVVGFTRFAEYLLVAEYVPQRNALELQISLDGKEFAPGLFPASMRPDNHAYTILESSTDSVFLHLTTSETLNAKWGNILKSNSNGTYYAISIPNVSRDNAGYVDFEKMIGLEGIAMVNIVKNPEEAAMTRRKELQTRITHNDGGSWRSLDPPAKDSRGQAFKCSETKCALHIHGFTERYDARATFSSPSIPGVMMGVGNVGETLAPYTDSDTFLSRDGGISWQEIRKDAHLWEFGDSGSILVLANDEEPTDKVLYSTDEGDSWHEYSFGRSLRIRAVRNMPSDTSRKFILYGHLPNTERVWAAVHLDFSALTNLKCVLDLEDPNNDDFELWSPADGRSEKCLFGRTTEYHRRKRDRNCFVGDTKLQESNKISNCMCTDIDFECNFNHVRDSEGLCVLADGAEALSTDTSWEQCKGDSAFWYDRTAYRKIPHSSCQEGTTLDRGAEHPCPGLGSKGILFWFFMALIVLGLTALFTMWWRRSPFARGVIRLPDRADGATRPGRSSFDDSGILATIASIPWFIIGLVGVGWSRVSPVVDRLPFRRRRAGTGGYRTVAVDEDAQVLRFEDEE